MLTPNIHGAYCNGLNNFINATNVTMVAQGRETEGSYQGRPALFRTDSVTFLANPALEDENFGPSALLIVCKDEGDLLNVAAKFDGQLSATLHYEEGDKAIAQAGAQSWEDPVQWLANGSGGKLLDGARRAISCDF
jgi:NADP-dependent aldehyde dehydrogenase